MASKNRDNDDIRYLNVQGFAGPHLRLVEEINNCFMDRHYPSVSLHLRSLLELLLTDILLKNPGPNAVFENREKAYRYGLHRLLENFWNLVFTDFKEFFTGYSNQTLKDYEKASWVIKKQGDKTAHEVSVKLTEKLLLKQRESTNSLFDFLWHAALRIPESIHLTEVKKEKEEMDMLSWTPSYPSPFPSRMQALRKGKEIYYFKFVVEIQPLKKSATINVAVSSNSDAIVFILDKPYRKFNWRKFRYETISISLYDNISNRIGMVHPTQFEFSGVYRPRYVDLISQRLIIRYRITGKTHDGTMQFDTRAIRIDIPLEDDTLISTEP